MIPWLRADRGSFSSPCQLTTICSSIQFQGISCPLLASLGTACTWYTHLYAWKTKHSYTRMKSLQNIFKRSFTINLAQASGVVQWVSALVQT